MLSKRSIKSPCAPRTEDSALRPFAEEAARGAAAPGTNVRKAQSFVFVQQPSPEPPANGCVRMVFATFWHQKVDIVAALRICGTVLHRRPKFLRRAAACSILTHPQTPASAGAYLLPLRERLRNSGRSRTAKACEQMVFGTFCHQKVHIAAKSRDKQKSPAFRRGICPSQRPYYLRIT